MTNYRDQFEAHFSAQGFEPEMFVRMNDGEYRRSEVEYMWEGWHSALRLTASEMPLAGPSVAHTDASKSLGDRNPKDEALVTAGETASNYRDMIIELCATRAQQTPLPQYGTEARHTGREEARKKIVESIRRLKSSTIRAQEGNSP